MYLARAFLNPLSRIVRADLADDTGLHRTLMRAFPDGAGATARQAHGVLYRVDEDSRRGRFVLLVQSTTRPDFSRLPTGYFLDLRDDLDLERSGATDNPAVREVDKERAAIVAGQHFAFRLRANTTKKIPKVDPASGERTKNGCRVPVRGDDARQRWLMRHAEQAGFRIDNVRTEELGPRTGRIQQCVTLGGALFQGVLEVTDPPRFCRALAEGIGPAKAFGFGLLSLQRMP